MGETAIKTVQRKLQDSIRRVRSRIASACERAGRPPDSVRLVAVTKSVEVDIIRAALDLGITDVGENRVQELTRRAAMIHERVKRKRILDTPSQPARPTWHMIGHLQRNKVKAVLQWADLIHSVDSLRLAHEISEHAGKQKQVVDVLLQVNVSEEKSKHGMAVGAVDLMTEQISRMPGLRLRGLMTMTPIVEDPEEVRGLFSRLREIAADIKTRGLVGEEFQELSMGMSADFEVAVEEGATMVRVGTALFEDLGKDSPVS